MNRLNLPLKTLHYKHPMKILKSGGQKHKADRSHWGMLKLQELSPFLGLKGQVERTGSDIPCQQKLRMRDHPGLRLRAGSVVQLWRRRGEDHPARLLCSLSPGSYPAYRSLGYTSCTASPGRPRKERRGSGTKKEEKLVQMAAQDHQVSAPKLS